MSERLGTKGRMRWRRTLAAAGAAVALTTLLDGCGTNAPDRVCTNTVGVSTAEGQSNPAEIRQGYRQAANMARAIQGVDSYKSVAVGSNTIASADKSVHQILVHPVELQAQSYLDYEAAALALQSANQIRLGEGGRITTDTISAIADVKALAGGVCDPGIRTRAEDGVSARMALLALEATPVGSDGASWDQVNFLLNEFTGMPSETVRQAGSQLVGLKRRGNLNPTELAEFRVGEQRLRDKASQVLGIMQENGQILLCTFDNREDLHNPPIDNPRLKELN